MNQSSIFTRVCDSWEPLSPAALEISAFPKSISLLDSLTSVSITFADIIPTAKERKNLFRFAFFRWKDLNVISDKPDPITWHVVERARRFVTVAKTLQKSTGNAEHYLAACLCLLATGTLKRAANCNIRCLAPHPQGVETLADASCILFESYAHKDIKYSKRDIVADIKTLQRLFRGSEVPHRLRYFESRKKYSGGHARELGANKVVTVSQQPPFETVGAYSARITARELHGLMEVSDGGVLYQYPLKIKAGQEDPLRTCGTALLLKMVEAKVRKPYGSSTCVPAKEDDLIRSESKEVRMVVIDAKTVAEELVRRSVHLTEIEQSRLLELPLPKLDLLEAALLDAMLGLKLLRHTLPENAPLLKNDAICLANLFPHLNKLQCHQALNHSLEAFKSFCFKVLPSSVREWHERLNASAIDNCEVAEVFHTVSDEYVAFTDYLSDQLSRQRHKEALEDSREFLEIMSSLFGELQIV